MSGDSEGTEVATARQATVGDSAADSAGGRRGGPTSGRRVGRGEGRRRRGAWPVVPTAGREERRVPPPSQHRRVLRLRGGTPAPRPSLLPRARKRRWRSAASGSDVALFACRRGQPMGVECAWDPLGSCLGPLQAPGARGPRGSGGGVACRNPLPSTPGSRALTTPGQALERVLVGGDVIGGVGRIRHRPHDQSHGLTRALTSFAWHGGGASGSQVGGPAHTYEPIRSQPWGYWLAIGG